MKQKIFAFLMSIIIFSVLSNPISAKTWNFENIGEFELPETVSFDKGEQKILSFEKTGGIKKFFVRSGATDGHYYTMTYTNAPHFSYGWATSQVLGLPYLLENNLYEYKNASADVLTDKIAQDLNAKIIKNNAIYKTKTPLVKIKKGKKYFWKGVFSISEYEKGILYNEEYLVILQNDGYQVYLGIICYDGDIRNVSNTISDIIENGKFKQY